MDFRLYNAYMNDFFANFETMLQIFFQTVCKTLPSKIIASVTPIKN